jgi:PD-(D/E)XK nuclease superfamily
MDNKKHKDSVMFWSNLEAYEDCPQKFLWGRGWHDIDLGRGLGRSKQKPEKGSEHHPLMGNLIQNVIERMYNDELWRDGANLKTRLKELLDKNFDLSVQRAYIDWGRSDCPPKTEMYQLCWDGIAGYLKTMKQHKLLGPYARAEVELPAWVNKHTPINGRADMIIRRDDTGVTILDGKNSKTKGKYTDPDQLRWYALCFWLAYGAKPDRLAFVYYRYPYGKLKVDTDGKPLADDDGNPTAETETGIDWVDFTEADLKGIATRAVDARKGMDFHKFDPKPEPSTCKFCDFETVCEARKATKKVLNRKSVLGQIESADGIIEF